eukprot:CAMPEP_0205800184 /NCGR_PEP_ID=MMETSP0205-20121125/1751_1 /ASSEMBLY_ACC=CAM_ASM_000278 /TAXON_ID=36767 /ORGANISM="Euplotes focardii, Strain TN1" /LENGTH=242 /DNA_ID=CAMNT_0053062835 /DNA_START=434 /DNA_END=1163 /DNA_ORIENTATION=+
MPKFGEEDGYAFQGSGGAGTQGGSGGGIIWIHTSDVLHIDGNIQAEGGNSGSMEGSSFGSGGGSGGAISLTTNTIQTSTDSTISVAGGKGRLGGGGGGGWIYGHINTRGNPNRTLEQVIGWNGIFNLSGGLSVNLPKDPDPAKNRANFRKASVKDHQGQTGHKNVNQDLKGYFALLAQWVSTRIVFLLINEFLVKENQTKTVFIFLNLAYMFQMTNVLTNALVQFLMLEEMQNVTPHSTGSL